MARPLLPMIERVRDLFAAGHSIVIMTARGSETGLDWRPVTEAQLEAWGVPYERLVTGKPAADVYVDDRAAAPWSVMPSQHVCVVAEIGINHQGSLETALALIEKAKEAGADLVKFQKRTPRLAVPRDQWEIQRETPWGTVSYIEYKEQLEFGEAEYDAIDRY